MGVCRSAVWSLELWTEIGVVLTCSGGLPAADSGVVRRRPTRDGGNLAHVGMAKPKALTGGKAVEPRVRRSGKCDVRRARRDACAGTGQC